MLGRLAAYARLNVVLFAAGVGVPAALSACGDVESGPDESSGVQAPNSQLTVLAQYEGGYDGEHFWYRPMAIDGQGAGGSSGDGVGVVRQAIETDQPNAFYTPPTGGAGGAAPQTNTILIEQMEFHDQTSWNTATCGPTPTNGSCVRWRLFNAFANSDLFRGYFYLTELTPPNGCPAGCSVVVQIPAPGAGVQTSVPDPGLLGVTPASGNGGAPGLWRYGLLERSGPEPRGQERWLAFVGSGTDPRNGKWGFHWVGQVRGTLVGPTRRVSLRDTTIDKAPFYTSNGIADGGIITSSNLQATPDGRFVAFASSSTTLSSHAPGAGNKVFRYDTTSGAVVVATLATGGTNTPSGCNSYHPSISSDGNRIAFQSAGCDLGYGTSVRSIYVRDISAGTTTLVTHGTASLATPPDSDSQQPRISANGEFVTFVSTAGNIIAGRPAGRLARFNDAYRYTVATGLIERANIPTTGAVNWPSNSQLRPDISGDGSRIVFDSYAQLLVPNDRAVNLDAFLYDFNGPGISMISVKQNGALLQSSNGLLATISSDGTQVAFIGQTGGSDSFVATPAATPTRLHVYRRTVASPASLEMIDVDPTGLEGNSSTGPVPPSLNSDGSLVGYLSFSTNLLRTASCNTPSGACMPVPTAYPSLYARDMSSPDPEVQRSFLVSQIRSKLNTATLPFVAAERGVSTVDSARTLFIGGARDAGIAIYMAAGGNSADWGQCPSAGGYQIYLSAISDALYQ